VAQDQDMDLSPATREEVISSLSFALRFAGRKRTHQADDVRHITWRWIPFAERKGLEAMTLGPAGTVNLLDGGRAGAR